MSLSAALFSDSQARLFRWVFGQPDRSFHLSELRRLTGLGSASLQRELRRLTEAGLLTSERVGNLRKFQANPDSPVFAELVALTRKTLALEPQLRGALAHLLPRLKLALIFGSVAKQTDTASSDVELLLVGDELTLGEVLQCLVPLEAELGRSIIPTLYSVAEFERRRAEPDSFVQRVLEQPILPLLGNPGELAGSG